MFQDTRKKDSSTMPKMFQDDENKIILRVMMIMNQII